LGNTFCGWGPQWALGYGRHLKVSCLLVYLYG
jgi:hypothetical protein